MIIPPYYPIIYVRGYAMSQGELEDTVATPYLGFNLGSTKYRQAFTGEAKPYVFDFPVQEKSDPKKRQNGFFNSLPHFA